MHHNHFSKPLISCWAFFVFGEFHFFFILFHHLFSPVSVFQAGGQWCSFSCFISLILHLLVKVSLCTWWGGFFFYILPLLIMDTLYEPDVYREGLHPYATSLYILNSKKQNRIIYFCIIHFIFCHFRKWNAQSILRGQWKVNMSIQTFLFCGKPSD